MAAILKSDFVGVWTVFAQAKITKFNIQLINKIGCFCTTITCTF